jgi:thymidylate synthase
MTVYHRPWERVQFWKERDANPFFHFMEGLAFLGGRYDVEFFATYAKQIRNYSDDGETLPASYGHRWRNYFDYDQLTWAIGRLRNNPADRRVVISMWNPDTDPMKADNGSKDVPCNTNIFLSVRGHQLDMMVNCRSNDIFWGAYGANAVHMSMLHEYLARSIGVGQGKYYQNSWNWHAYEDFYKIVMNERQPANEESSLRGAIAQFLDDGEDLLWDPYNLIGHLIPMMRSDTYDRRADFRAWDAQLAIFLAGGMPQGGELTDPFFTRVAVPIRDAHAAYRRKDYNLANDLIAECQAADWRLGCHEWLNRRAAERERVAAAA